MGIVDRYHEQARKELEPIAEKLPLTSVVLDNWGGAVRLVYGADFVSGCGSKCEECPLLEIVGVDMPDLKRDSFVTTLRLASKGALEVFPSKQRYLNCKTLEQYLGAIVSWLVERCNDNENMAAELDLAKGFRVLLAGDNTDLEKVEKQSREYVVMEALRRMAEGDLRKEFLLSYSRQIGLIE